MTNRCRRLLTGAASALAAGIVAVAGSTPAMAHGRRARITHLTTVNVAVLPISAVAPVYVGINKGFFRRQGLAVKLHVMQAGAAIIPAMLSGQIQFGFANIVSDMIAANKGLPIRILTQGSQAGPGKSAKFEAVIVKGTSTIKRPAQLKGQSLAVNSLSDIGGVAISGALKKFGVNPRTVHFTELSFPEINEALSAGRIAAAYQTEPFLAEALKSGDRVLFYQYPKLAKTLTIATYSGDTRYMTTHSRITREFRTAMNESLRYTQRHQGAARQVSIKDLGIKPALAKAMVLPGWGTSLNPRATGMTVLAKLAKQQGLITKLPNFKALIVK